jgi:RHS repeat-associated protein
MASNAMQNYTQQFTYDELGNILQMKSVGRWTRDYNYDILHNNYLTGHAPRSVDYTYDEHGNMLKMPHLQSMHYDYQDQLNKVVLDASGNTSYYIYDAGGQRVRKVVEKGNVREERIYVGSYERFIKTVNGSQTIERISVSIAEVAEDPREEEDNSRAVYQIDLNKRIALVEYIEGQSPTIRYQLGNHLGSASLELNATGQIISYEEFHPFGTTSYRSGTNETEVSLKRYKYIGKERDEETGLYYYGARYYAAWIGRFVSVDPLAEKYLNLSPYVYVADNPIKYIDPDGRDIFIKHDNQRFLYSEGILFKNVEGGWVAFEPDKDSYLALIHEALAILESKPDGKELVQYFKGDKNFVEIRARLKKERGTGNEIKAFAIVTEKKPQGSMVPTEKGLLRSPLFVTLGHELAHRKEIIEGTFDDNEWFLINGEKIINAEKTATHYENIIRAEHKLPLRTYYAVDTVNREGIGPLLIENGKSLFFDLWGKPFDYRYRVGRRDFINSL